MNKRLWRLWVAGIIFSVVAGLAGEAFATPVQYTITGTYFADLDKDTVYNYSGFLILDDTPIYGDPLHPEGTARYEMTEFAIQSDPSHSYDFSFSGTEGSFSFNFLLDGSLDFYGSDGITVLQAFDSIPTSNTNVLLDSYHFVESFQYTFPDGLHRIGFHELNLDQVPVPEPASMILFGTGLAGLVAARSRKKKNQRHKK